MRSVSSVDVFAKVVDALEVIIKILLGDIGLKAFNQTLMELYVKGIVSITWNDSIQNQKYDKVQ